MASVDVVTGCTGATRAKIPGLLTDVATVSSITEKGVSAHDPFLYSRRTTSFTGTPAGTEKTSVAGSINVMFCGTIVYGLLLFRVG